MTREQETFANGLAYQHGRVHCNLPYADGSVEMTVPDGTCVLVSQNGAWKERPFNHNVNWDA